MVNCEVICRFRTLNLKRYILIVLSLNIILFQIMLFLGLYWSEINSKFLLKWWMFYSSCFWEPPVSVQPAGGGRVLGRFTFLNCLVRRERASWIWPLQQWRTNQSCVFIFNVLNHRWIYNRRVFFRADTMGKKDKSDRGKMDAMLSKKKTI